MINVQPKDALTVPSYLSLTLRAETGLKHWELIEHEMKSSPAQKEARKIFNFLYELDSYKDQLEAIKATMNSDIVDMINDGLSDKQIIIKREEQFTQFINDWLPTYQRIQSVKAFL